MLMGLAFTGEEIAAILREAAQLITALAALVAAVRARRAADLAREAAEDAGRKAADAAKEQLIFALRDAARLDQTRRLVRELQKQETNA